MSLDAPRRYSNKRTAIPPAPPLPPERVSTQPAQIQKPQKTQPGFLDRLLRGARKQPQKPPVTAQELKGELLFTPNFGHVTSQSTSHKTGLRLRALDINEGRTHVVLAGGKILKTVKVEGGNCVEDVNIRNSAVNYPREAFNEATSKNGPSVRKQPVQDVAALHRETFDIEDVAWSNGRWSQQVATAAANGKINLYDLERPGVEVGRLHEHNRQVHKVDFSPGEGQLLLSASQDGTVRLWDLRTARHVMKCESTGTFPGRNDGVRHTKWSPKSSVTFALATDNGTVQRWDTRQTRAPILRISAHTSTCSSIDWHPDGRHLVSAGKDQDVKVWDLRGDRKQKPMVQLRTPFAVQNVRWRPPCYVSGNTDELVKQCTHLATSYKTQPTVHIWDLRRPFIPFKEFSHCINDGTTDMLWHSKDLLWTVGLAGEFNQSDVRYLPRTLDRRPLSTLSIGSDGEVVAFSQRRARRYASGVDEDDKGGLSKPGKSKHSKSPAAQGQMLGQGDDSLDENFLSTSLPWRRPSRRGSAKPGSSIGSTPPSYEDFGKPVTELDRTMQSCETVRPDQLSYFGRFCEAGPSAASKVTAHKWRMLKTDQPLSLSQLSDAVDDIYSTYARSAFRVGQYDIGREYEVFKHLLIEDLRSRYPAGTKFFGHSEDGDLSSPRSGERALSIVPTSSPRSVSNSRVSSLARALQGIDDAASASDAATPLARPVPDRSANESTEGPQTPDVDLTFGALEASPEASREMVRPRSAYQLGSSHVNGSWKDTSDEVLMSTAGSLATSERSDAESSSMVPYHRNDSFGRSLSPPRKLDRQESNEPFFPSSAGSTRFDSAHGSFATGIVQNTGHSLGMASIPTGSLESNAVPTSTGTSASRSMADPSVNTSIPASSDDSYQSSNMADHGKQVDVDSSSIGKKEEGDEVSKSKISDHGPPPSADSFPDPSTFLPFPDEQTQQISSPAAHPTESTPANMPQSVEQAQKAVDTITKPPESLSLLKELLENHADMGNAPAAAKLFASIVPLLNDLDIHDQASLESYISPLLLQSILQNLEETFRANEMYIEATEVRNLLYHTSNPDTYEEDYPEADFIQTFACGTCGGLVKHHNGWLRCEACGKIQPPCPYCWMTECPFSLNKDKKTSNNKPHSPHTTNDVTDPAVSGASDPSTGGNTGSNLMAGCGRCGHYMHMACAEEWLDDIDGHGGMCPVDGCDCDCAPGYWRDKLIQREEEEEKRAAEERKARYAGGVAEDPYKAGESAAVKRVMEEMRK